MYDWLEPASDSSIWADSVCGGVIGAGLFTRGSQHGLWRWALGRPLPAHGRLSLVELFCPRRAITAKIIRIYINDHFC